MNLYKQMVIIILFSILIIGSSAIADETTSTNRATFIIPSLTFGTITGQAAEDIFTYKDEIADRIYLGLGLGFEIHGKSRLAYGGGLNMFYKNVKQITNYNVIGYSLSGTAMFKISENFNKSFYLSLGLGLGKGSVSDVSTDFGLSRVIKTAIGFYNRTTQTGMIKYELYLRTVMLSDEIKDSTPLPIDYNGSLVGFEISLGFGI